MSTDDSGQDPIVGSHLVLVDDSVDQLGIEGVTGVQANGNTFWLAHAFPFLTSHFIGWIMLTISVFSLVGSRTETSAGGPPMEQ